MRITNAKCAPEGAQTLVITSEINSENDTDQVD